MPDWTCRSPPPVWQRQCWNSSIAIDIIDATFPHAKRKDAAMDWNPIEGNSNQLEGKIKERWGDFTEGGVDKIIGHQKVRCVRRKQRVASLAEIWDVVSFWTKLFAFSWLLMVQVAGLMMGRIFPELSIYRRYRALGARLPFEGETGTNFS